MFAQNSLDNLDEKFKNIYFKLNGTFENDTANITQDNFINVNVFMIKQYTPSNSFEDDDDGDVGDETNDNNINNERNDLVTIDDLRQLLIVHFIAKFLNKK